MQRPIRKKDYEKIRDELEFFERNGSITAEQKDDMLAQYQVAEGVSFIRILLLVGALLLGAGVFSFIASNWMYIGKPVKFLMIIAAVLAVDLAGWKMEKRHPKTARAMYDLGILFFGAGIFLVGQIFNLGGDFRNAFLLWGLGTLPIGWILKDKWICTFACGLLFFFLSIGFGENGYPTMLLIGLATAFLYWLNVKVIASRLFLFAANALAIEVLAVFFFKLAGFEDRYAVYPLIGLFLVGISMLEMPVQEKMKAVFRLQGHLLHGLAGILLTFSSYWEQTFFGSHFNIVFSVGYFLFVLFLIKKGSLLSIFILCAFILRFYFDFSYDFLPKSAVFIIGGLIFIAFGYYFEKQRKEGGDGRA
ncbi:DUF2157 domain-containing protein [Heyndrickxia acidiproducens]|uniref:DUF2157 domain-containing protein n=1 Tax=Heyndrickxia acidiproducens TaxID=1121084 RepID=UPI00036C1354|nr:DUF2157 domain-containing protein [Heyndrickxia acidiproducens]